MNDPLAAWSPRILSVLRIVAGLLFLEHGLSKFFGWPGTAPAGFQAMGLLGLAGAIELIGGILLAIGLFARPVAFILSGEMAAAYFMAHFPRGFFPILNGGEAAILFCFTFLYLAAAGPGPRSLDASTPGGPSPGLGLGARKQEKAGLCPSAPLKGIGPLAGPGRSGRRLRLACLGQLECPRRERPGLACFLTPLPIGITPRHGASRLLSRRIMGGE